MSFILCVALLPRTEIWTRRKLPTDRRHLMSRWALWLIGLSFVYYYLTGADYRYFID